MALPQDLNWLSRQTTQDNNGCWIWQGRRNRYAVVRVDGKPRKAHRVAWELARGPIPEGVYVLHRCDVPGCVNPDHLFLGTQADNVRDCHAKGRNAPPPICPAHLRARGSASGMVKYPGLLAGERNGRSLVTDAQRAEIREARAAGEARWRLADRFGVSESQIGRICSGVVIADRREWRPESRQRASERMKGRKMSPEAIEKTAAAHRGMKRSDETRAKQRAAWARRRAASA